MRSPSILPSILPSIPPRLRPRIGTLALVVTAAVALAAPGVATRAVSAQAGGAPIDFAETFALAVDRTEALKRLIPGTEEYYYYHCLHHQNEGGLEHVAPLLDLWIRRHGRTPRVLEIENRQALLGYDRAPEASLQFLRERLGLRFEHRRDIPGEESDLPARLDAGAIGRAALSRRALARHPGTVRGFAPSAFDFLIGENLPDDTLHDLLARLVRPDYPNLPALVVRDLGHRASRGFGSLAIHRHLLLDQLEECLSLRPALLNEMGFIEAYLPRLRPNPDVDWRRDPGAREAYLDRLEAFAARLSPAHNALKAHVLYHRLAHDRAQGARDKARFLAYLRLPRPVAYVNPRWIERRARDAELARLDRGYPTDLPPIGDDETLVRDYLMDCFREEAGYDAYAEFVREDYLKRLFAEAKILHGIGDMERWYSLLGDPAHYEQLEKRVELAFAPTQRTWYAGSDPVSIELDVKNVPTLIVKVFEIDAYSYLRDKGREVDATLDLDGLVANQETTHTYDESPLRRVRRRFDFPALREPGVYVVEFIGNGVSSRAVIRKGRLRFLERAGAAGHVFTVFDAANRRLRDATLWLAGHHYTADERGEILVPFTSKPGPEKVILRHGRLATLATFSHLAEHYTLAAGVFVDRETLLPGQRAKILVRPALRVNGRPADLALVEDAVLVLRSRDQAGVESTQEIRGLALRPDGELVHEIQVPERLALLTVTLKGRVRVVSQDQNTELASATALFPVSQMEAEPWTELLILGRTEEGWVLDLLGKNGEPKPGRAVSLSLAHRDFTDGIDVSLQTDAQGRIHLGPLPGITELRATGQPYAKHPWRLDAPAHPRPDRLHGRAGETLRIPWHGAGASPARATVSFLEMRAGAYFRDSYDRLALAGGFLELRDLPAGDYRLELKEEAVTIDVRVSEGEVQNGWVLGETRLLEHAARAPLQITGVEAGDEHIVVRLAAAGKDARVHVIAGRFDPPFHLFECLGAPPPFAAPARAVDAIDSSYHAGRRIGDEYRYILERRFAPKFPGNMLLRPGLILNPWALEPTRSVAKPAGQWGEDYRGPAGTASPRIQPPRAAQTVAADAHPGVWANLDFLPAPAVLHANLRPGPDGTVRVPRAGLGEGQQVHVLAVDAAESVHRSIVLPERPLVPKDVRLTRGFDPRGHFTEQKRIETAGKGDTVVIRDLSTAALETYDSLDDVYRLFGTLRDDPAWSAFSFVVRWPKLAPEEKRKHYAEHACHELHFFLHRKDPAFFRDVVEPYLRNKMHKTFLDHYLLGADLRSYLEPWAYARLNVVERILLAERIEGEADATARHLEDVFELIDVDPERLSRFFATAIAGRALDGAAFGRHAAAAEDPATEDDTAEGLLRKQAENADDDMPRAPAEKARNVLQDQLKADLARRLVAPRFFRAPEVTQRYVEQNYYRRPIQEQHADLIRVNGFWRDFAAARGRRPFVSAHLAEAAGSFPEMMLALAVLDLPFEAEAHATAVEDGRMSLAPSGPLILFVREVEPAEPAADRAPILVTQNFFRLDDRYRFEANRRFDKYVTGEFVAGVVYGCQAVLTNPTSTAQELELLLQIPRGSLPVKDGFVTRCADVSLGAYAAAKLDYHFYFPRAGTFPHYPVHVAHKGELLAFAEPATFRVVEQPSGVDTSSWRHVSQLGSTDDVIDYLKTHNIERVDLQLIAWRMRDRTAFDRVLALLRARHVYHHTLWSYGLLHGHAPAIREVLRHSDAFLRSCGAWLESPLVTIDPVERRWYQHADYEPLFNARAHRFGGPHRILNEELAQQYRDLLAILGCRPRLDADDWMTLTYFLLLQDRIGDALATFARVQPSALPMQLQHDYMRAYLAFFTGDHAVARGLAEKYRSHPVARWRSRFLDVLDHLDEAAGRRAGGDGSEGRTEDQTRLAAREPDLDFEVEGGKVRIRHRNLDRCEVRYYPMDIEFLFSASPFVPQGSGGAFAYVAPNRRDEVALPADGSEITLDLPETFRRANVLIEIRGEGIARRHAYYANALAVRVSENYGQVEIAHAATGTPLPGTYVKVFARFEGGAVGFYKDGYTDLRGRFDYASLSGPQPGAVERFAILVLSESHGAVIREARAPKQ